MGRDLAKQIGENIRSVRDAVGLTQDRFRIEVGIGTLETLGNYERGRTEAPLSVLIAISEKFGVPISALIPSSKRDAKKTANSNTISALALGERIAALRLGRGQSQGELADHLGMLHSQVSRWESGETEPSATNMLRLARLFGVTVLFLLDGKAEGGEGDSGGGHKGCEGDQCLDFKAEIDALAEELIEADRRHPGMAEGFLLLLKEGLLDTPEDRQDLLDLAEIFRRREQRK